MAIAALPVELAAQPDPSQEGPVGGKCLET
jgi:hypothetical protein